MSEDEPKGLIRPLILGAALLGIIEGFIWTLLSVTSIVLYYVDLKPSESHELSHSIYALYYTKNASNNGGIIKADVLSYFAFIYLVLSFSWFIISSLLLWRVLKKKSNNETLYDYSVLSWTIVACLVALLDLILLSLLAHDYAKALNDTITLVSLGIMMTISARGFVLWIINGIFTVILGIHYYQRYHQIIVSNGNSESAIDAYADPLPWLQGPAAFDAPSPKMYENKGFQYEEPAAPLNRNNYVNTRNNNQNLRPQSDNSWINKNRDNAGNKYLPPVRVQPDPGLNRTAKIGKLSPPLNWNAPNIPEPDYSPPNTPIPKGVLRPKSNYTMY